MGTLKILAFLCMSLSYGFAVDFSTCSNAVKDEACNMTCTTQDFNQLIRILCNGSSVGSCGIVCSTDMYKEGSTITYFSIARLSYQTHLCDWSCAYGSSNSPTSSFTIYSGLPNQVNTTAKKQGNNALLETIVDCIHPSNPVVSVMYSYQVNGLYQTLHDQPVTLRSSSGSCSDSVENKLTATSEVSGDRKEMQGKTVFFKMEFSQYPGGASLFSIYVSEPISFEGCDYSDAELFLCGFSLFLIEFIVTIVIVSLMKWKMIIGGFTKLKVIVSCAFLLVALIIGIILGVVLLECSKRNLSLGLGLGLGFLLAAAHLVTIYVIHKKCEKDPKMDDDERKGTPASTSKVEFTDRKVSHVHLGTINGNKVDSQPKEPHKSLLESHRSSPEPHRSLLEPHRSLPEPHRSLPEPHRSLPEPHRPLPEPPATHPKQLDPIDDGATSSEKKKKKKKKKKRSEAREEPEDQQE